jgi:hypothetical protein
VTPNEHTEVGYLRLRFADDGDGTGKLYASAEARGFAAKGAAWFGISRIEEFAIAVAAFPLPADKQISVAGGFWKDGQLTQEHLAIEIYQIDSRGHIGVQVRASTELWGKARKRSQLAAKLEIITSYERLRRFSEDLHELVKGRIEEVLLEGENL